MTQHSCVKLLRENPGHREFRSISDFLSSREGFQFKAPPRVSRVTATAIGVLACACVYVLYFADKPRCMHMFFS